MNKGTLYLCATPIGNLGDITARCLETLESVDLIAAEDTRQTLKLLNHFGIHTPMTSYYEHNKREKGNYLIEKLLAGESIAVVSDAGTPAISDPGEDLAKLAIANGIRVTPVPGAVAGICALITSGLATGRFCFEGFLSMNRRQRKAHLEEIKNETRTMLFYEAPHKLRATLSDLCDTLGADRKIVLAREITKLHEEFVRTTLGEAVEKYKEENPKGEFVLVIDGKNIEETETDYTQISVEEHVHMLIEEGMSESDAIKAAAKQRGVPKNEVYSVIKKK